MAYYYGGSGMLNDSAEFTYDAQGKLLTIQNVDGYFSYTYDGDKISSVRFTEQVSGNLVFVDSVWYNSSGNISSLVSHHYDGWFGPSNTTFSYIFEYQNNLLWRLTTLEFDNSSPGSQPDTMVNEFTWSMAGNIEKMYYVDQGDRYDSIVYSYDASPNYFKAIHPHFFLLDRQFQLHAGFEPHLAYFYSKNNVMGFEIYSGFTYDVGYGLDSTSRLTSVTLDGADYMKYKYTCQ